MGTGKRWQATPHTGTRACATRAAGWAPEGAKGPSWLLPLIHTPSPWKARCRNQDPAGTAWTQVRLQILRCWFLESRAHSPQGATWGWPTHHHPDTVPGACSQGGVWGPGWDTASWFVGGLGGPAGEHCDQWDHRELASLPECPLGGRTRARGEEAGVPRWYRRFQAVPRKSCCPVPGPLPLAGASPERRPGDPQQGGWRELGRGVGARGWAGVLKTGPEVGPGLEPTSPFDPSVQVG